MINAKHTKRVKLQIAIESDFTMPQECILCGAPEHSNFTINQTSASALAGSISTSTNQFPLCETCSEAHFKRTGKLYFSMITLFVAGLAAIATLPLLGDASNGYDSPLQAGIAIVASLLLISAFVCMKLKGKAFPIKFSQKPESLMSGKIVTILKCPNSDIYDRIEVANKPMKVGTPEAQLP